MIVNFVMDTFRRLVVGGRVKRDPFRLNLKFTDTVCI